MTTKEYKSHRIAKVIARFYNCSRRDAEKIILQNRVKLNGSVVNSPALNVVQNDKIEIDDKPLKLKDDFKCYIYHKPRGLVTTHSDERGRKTVFESLPEEFNYLISAGRLDINSEGLLILTNNRALAKALENPSNQIPRSYFVRGFGKFNESLIKELGEGVVVDGVAYKPIICQVTRKNASNIWLELTLFEGKNREIRKVLEHFGIKVNRLIRASFGGFKLGDLPQGQLQKVDKKTCLSYFDKDVKQQILNYQDDFWAV